MTATCMTNDLFVYTTVRGKFIESSDLTSRGRSRNLLWGSGYRDITFDLQKKRNGARLEV